MIARLKVFLGMNRTMDYSLDDSEDNLIGQGKECRVRIESHNIARVHAKLLYREGLWWAFACDTGMGIWVNGSKTDCAVLLNGTRLRFGDTEACFSNSLKSMEFADLMFGRRLVDQRFETPRTNGAVPPQRSLTSPEIEGDFSELLGTSHAMRELKKRITRIARASGGILVRGESGVGKELVSRAIHRNSQRAAKPMLSVNCAAIPSELIESQLFGHVKGAFTGADREHVGYFQQADQGTLFLDEVGELNLEGQAKLLRILEGHPFLPVGSTREIKVDVRVVSATNRDLREFVIAKKFREDLYYRLSTFEVDIPPLRMRASDIELLAQHYFEQFRLQHDREHLGISEEAMETLREYSWPGNVRQLRNVIESAVVLADGFLITPNDLNLRDIGNLSHIPGPITRIDKPHLGDDQPAVPLTPKLNQSAKSDTTFDTLNVTVWEQRLIQEALARTQGNIPAAAELLGMARATLYRKLEKGHSSSLVPSHLGPVLSKNGI
jgi:transcriptional regulator with GAF, ATPase, and Fis domain